MNYHRLLVASVLAALTTIVAPVFPQEAVESASPENIEPKPIVEKSPEEKPSKRAREEATEKAVRDLQDSMTAEQFKAAGLDKLSPEELKNLNASLQGSRRAAEKKAAEKATAEVTKKMAAESRAKMDEILSRVDGAFSGVTGHTIIKLEDGTTWKQANVDDHYRAQVTDRPPVKVWRGPFGYKMRVVGTGEFYVDPVR
jgi:hypothetical protein